MITGGSSGIGLAIVNYFLSRDFTVFNLDIQPSDKGEFIYCDVTSYESVEKAIEHIAKSHSIDVLISNAGMHFSANIENTSLDDFSRVFDLNVKAAFYVSKAVIPVLKQQGCGVIVYIGSDQSTIGKPNSFVYNLSKHALASMTKTMALDYADYNVRAVGICAGTIETPLYHNAINTYCEKSGAKRADIHQQEAALQPLGRIGQPNDVAALAWFLASDEASFITGSLHAVDGGYTAK